MKTALLIFYASLLVPSLSAAETPANQAESPNKVQIYGWQYSRQRKTTESSNRVIAGFIVKNTSDKPLNQLTATVTYSTGLGERVGGPLTQNFGELKPGEKKQVIITGDFIPVFGSYEIVIRSANHKEAWFSNSDTGQPQPRSGEPISGSANLVVLGKEAAADKNWRFSGTVRVENEGTVEAKDAKITVTFYDFKKKKMMDWSGPLGKGAVEAGPPVNIPFAVPNAPRNFSSYSIQVTHDKSPEAALSGGDFANIEDVEFAKFKFNRPDPKSTQLKVDCQVRNGLPVPVQQVKLSMVFMGQKRREIKRFAYELPGQLESGEMKPVTFDVTELPAYVEFEQAITYEKAGAPAAIASKAAVASAKFENKEDVEVVITDAVKNDDKSVSLAVALRNGKHGPVKDVIVSVTFSKADGSVLTATEKTLTDVVQPAEERNFVMKAADASGFNAYSFTFKYTELPAPRTKVGGETHTADSGAVEAGAEVPQGAQ